MQIKIGTRGSKLALWQAYHVSDLLKAGGVDSEIVIIETKGDKILDQSLSKIGSKGLFTEEIEEKLRDGSIDIAVHSAKDVQSDLDELFEIVAFTEREVVNDVLISKNLDVSLRSGEPLVVGTSSVRRVAFLRHLYPHITIVDMRGNLQTRMSKLEAGTCDAMLLAYAGVHRMELDSNIAEIIPTADFIPAVGQGSVAIEIATTLAADKVEAVRRLVNHPSTEICLVAERAYLKAMQGGCSIPVFGLATHESDGQLRLEGGIISVDGQQLIREVIYTEATLEGARSAGESLANRVLNLGGKEILAAIKASKK